jgi:alkanesulfonate monooxygenase SsuD/methylene tetrahydromethanopterin reductase-like flavin-dependent oxidoreductase (luciferase family)
MTAPVRFGIMLLQNLPYPEMVARCQLVEDLDYDSVWVADHFVNPHNIGEDWFDGWTILAALAART